MLCLTLLPGEYFTVGDDTVIQFDRFNGGRVHITIHAPREVTILRGEVLERSGGKRPACVYSLNQREKKPAP